MGHSDLNFSMDSYVYSHFQKTWDFWMNKTDVTGLDGYMGENSSKMSVFVDLEV